MDFTCGQIFKEGVIEYKVSGEKTPTLIEKKGNSLSLGGEPVVIYYPCLFYRYGLQGANDPYADFLTTMPVSSALVDCPFPRKIVVPQAFIEEGGFYLSEEERSVLYVLPEKLALAYFDFLTSMLIFSSARQHAARVAVIDLPLRDPFELSRAGSVDAFLVPIRNVKVIAVETKKGQYILAPSAGAFSWRCLKGARANNAFWCAVDTSFTTDALVRGVAAATDEEIAQATAGTVQPLFRGEIKPGSLDPGEISQLVVAYSQQFSSH